MRSHFAALLLAALPGALHAGEFPGAEGLVARRAPWLGEHVRFERLRGAAGDAFTLRSEGDTVVVQATDAISAEMGLGWYLKYYCHRSMSHMGDNLSPVTPLPSPVPGDKPVTDHVVGAPPVRAQLLHVQLHHGELLLMGRLGA